MMYYDRIDVFEDIDVKGCHDLLMSFGVINIDNLNLDIHNVNYCCKNEVITCIYIY